MSRYFDDELTHSGVKGMKWRKHKYKSAVKDANGNLKYFYYHDLFNTAPVTGVGGKFDGSQKYFLGPNPNHTTRFSNSRASIEKDSPVVKKRLENDRRSDALNEKKNASANRLSKTEPKQDSHARQERRVNEARAKRAEKKDKDIGKRSREYIQDRRSNTGTSPLTRKEIAWAKDSNGKLRLKSTVRTGRSGEQKQRDEKRAAESAKKERTRRIRQAEANKEQAERRKRIRQAEANRQQVIDRKIKKRSIQAYEDWIKEGQRLDRAKATTPAEKRKNADEYRKHDHRIETVGYSNVGDDFKKSMRIAYYKKDYATGDTSRYTERFTPSKETKKRLRRNKRKKAVADTKRAIDKGRKAVEGFFTPKKKKKR